MDGETGRVITLDRRAVDRSSGVSGKNKIICIAKQYYFNKKTFNFQHFLVNYVNTNRDEELN